MTTIFDLSKYELLNIRVHIYLRYSHYNNTIFIAKMFSILCVAANTSTYIVQHSGGACLKRFAQDVV